jgi:threonine/homoserine/homoserine lactone efflux protein
MIHLQQHHNKRQDRKAGATLRSGQTMQLSNPGIASWFIAMPK